MKLKKSPLDLQCHQPAWPESNRAVAGSGAFQYSMKLLGTANGHNLFNQLQDQMGFFPEVGTTVFLSGGGVPLASQIIHHVLE